MPDGAYDDDDVPTLIAQTYLPEPLPDHWAILPKRLLQWAGVNILLLGAALGSLLTALVASIIPLGHLHWGLVGVILLIYVIRKFVLTPAGDAALDEARKALEENASTSARSKKPTNPSQE